MTNRRLRAIWAVGQHTNVSREFQLLEESDEVPGTYEPVDLTDADVTVTLVHNSWGHTAVDELEGEVTDADEGEAVFTFTAEHLAAEGDHRIQFEVDYGDEEQLVPPNAGDWIIAVGRRAAGADLPLDISELTAGEATIGDLVVDHLEVSAATISEVIGDPEISSLSIESLDVDELAGGIVTDGPLDGLLHGPGLTIDDGDLAVTLDIEEVEGLTNPINEHVQGNNYDLLDFRHAYLSALTVGDDGPIEGIASYALDDDNVLQGFDHQFMLGIRFEQTSVFPYRFSVTVKRAHLFRGRQQRPRRHRSLGKTFRRSLKRLGCLKRIAPSLKQQSQTISRLVRLVAFGKLLDEKAIILNRFAVVSQFVMRGGLQPERRQAMGIANARPSHRLKGTFPVAKFILALGFLKHGCLAQRRVGSRFQ